MHLGFEAGDVAVAKVLAQFVDLLQLQEVDAQHLDCLHHLHASKAESKALPFSANQRKKEKAPRIDILTPDPPRAHPSAPLPFFFLCSCAISAIPRGEIHKNYCRFHGNFSQKIPRQSPDVATCLVILQRPLSLTRLWGCSTAVSCCWCKAWASLKRTP